MMKNKKIIATIGASVLLIAGGITAFLMKDDQPKETTPAIQIEEKIVTQVKENVEYGSDLSEKAFIVTTTDGEKEVKFTELLPAVDTSKVGQTTHEYTYENHTFEVEVTVADTAKPTIAGVQEKFEFKADTKVEDELKKIITAKDPVDGDLEVAFEISAKENNTNEFNVVAKAADKNDNTTIYEFEVVVKEKVVVKEDPKPSTSTPAVSAPSTNNKPAATKQSNPAPTKPETNPGESTSSGEGVSAEFPNGTVTQVGSVPSGATVTYKMPDGYIYNFNKTFPSGANVSSVTVCTYVGKEMIVIMRILDSNGVMGGARLHEDGSISYTFGYPTLTDADMEIVRSLEAQFRAAFVHNK